MHSRSWIPGVVFTVTLLFLSWYAPHELVMGNDLFAQQFAAENYLKGQGLGYTRIPAFNFDELYQQPLKEWPFTLTWLLAICFRLLGSWSTVTAVLCISGVWLLLVAVRRTLHQLRFSAGAQVFVYGFLLVNPLLYNQFSLSDWLSLAATAWAFSAFVQLLQAPDASWRQVLVCSFLFYLPAFFRYQYYPVVLLFPSALLWLGYGHRHAVVSVTALKTICLTSLLLVGQLLLFFFLSKSATGLPERLTGFSPANLLRTDSFFLKSLFRLDYWLYQWPQQLMVTSRVAAVVSLLLFFALGLRLFSSKKAAIAPSAVAWMQTVWMYTLILFLFFCLLSISYPLQTAPFTTFTYVAETRYYAPAMYLLVLVVVHLCLHSSVRWKGMLLGAILLFNLLLFAKYLYNLSKRTEPLLQTDWSIRDRQQVRERINAQLLRPDQPLLISWYPTAHSILQQYRNPTIVLRRYQEVFQLPQQIQQPFYLAFGTEFRWLSKQQLAYLQEQGFAVLYEDAQYRVYFKEMR